MKRIDISCVLLDNELSLPLSYQLFDKKHVKDYKIAILKIRKEATE